ncbi:periodic tryptophan protein 1 homolog isoform X2 [Corticium candelabrum]|nr:periodic tryptophan protein 1 homolog isoform X2 [Corticium candelabrum]
MEVELEDSDERANVVAELEDEIDKLYMTGYDDEELEGVKMDGAGMAGLTYYASNVDDPYITLKDEANEDEDESIRIKPQDNMIVCGKADGDMSTLDVYVYDADEDHLFVHHNVLLSAFPLAVEWLDYDPHPETGRGNYIAVGTMDPFIEVWDLDVINEVEPVLVLGRNSKKSKSKKKTVHGHSDAVMSLAWNKTIRNILASGSADQTIQLWDMSRGESVHSIAHHTDKVQSLMWHPYEANSLLSGSMDKTARVYDCRSPDSSVKSWSFEGEVENVIWNHLDPYYFLVGTDNGFVMGVDARSESSVFTLHAHQSAVTALCLSSEIPGCLLTASEDKTVKVWDIKDYRPAHISTTDFKLGPVFSAVFSPDNPLVIAAGGQKNGLKVRNLAEAAQVWRHFESRERVVPLSAIDAQDTKRVSNPKPQPPTEYPDQSPQQEMRRQLMTSTWASATVPPKKKKKSKKRTKQK